MGHYENLDFLHDGASRQSLQFFNIGVGVEYGILDWLTADAQWIPGLTLDSGLTFTPDFLGLSDTNINGFDDMWVGVKVQVLGQKGIIFSRSLRLALEPVIIVAMPDVNWDEQNKLRSMGADFTMLSLAKHAFGFGGRVSFDFYLADFFFVTLLGDYRRYFPRENAQLATDMPRGKTEWGPDVTFEVEPHLEFDIADGIMLAFGAPLVLASYGTLHIDGAAVDGTLSSRVYVSPYAAILLAKTRLPVEVDLQVPITLYATDLPVINSAILEVKISIPLG
jgi:hypothetical protein